MSTGGSCGNTTGEMAVAALAREIRILINTMELLKFSLPKRRSSGGFLGRILKKGVGAPGQIFFFIFRVFFHALIYFFPRNTSCMAAIRT